MPAAKAASPSGRSRARLRREQVLEAALAVIDEAGIEAVTMRRIAGDLGVDPMTLYRHVDGKEALLDGVVETLWGQVGPLPTDDAGWDEALQAFATSLRAVIRAHPAAAPLMLTRPALPRATLEVYDGLLARLRDAGFDDRDAGRLVRVVTSIVMTEAAGSLRPAGREHGSAQEEDGPGTVREPADLWITLAQLLPDDTPPELIRTASLVCAPQEADDDVAFLVDLVVRGADELDRGSAPD